MSFTVSPVEPAAAPLLAEMELRCFSDPWTAEIFDSGRSRYFLLSTADGTPAGYAGLSWVLDEGSLDNIAVLPEFRRQGAAEALLAEVEALAREKRLAVIYLEARESNTPALALYRKRGYVTVGRRKNYYEHPREDAILMTLEL